MISRAQVLALLVVLSWPSVGVGGDKPSLDDFYERGRSRAEGFEGCLGYCDGRRVLGLLLGAQLANPSVDALRPALAEGLRVGLDAGIFFLDDGYSVARTKAWVDLLRIDETGELITDLVSQTTVFYTSGGRGEGVHVQGDLLLADRTEIEPEDFAELQLRPYRIVDGEVEAALVTFLMDKEARLTFPVGFGQRVRLDERGSVSEARRTVTGAVAARAFQKRVRHHYQLDMARLTHVSWETPTGDASAVKASLGYQRLSPDIDPLQIWLLFGWGWFEGEKGANGPLARVGAEVDLGGAHKLGTRYDADFALERQSRRFTRLHHLRFFYRADLGWFRASLGYELVAVAERGRLHALTPEIIVRPFERLGLELGVRHRLAFAREEGGVDAPDEDRFTLSVDLLF